ncbi:MAG: hypothetical protein M3O70_26780 [Actinomycetota bacterium]|nr:hypothetical protein [Actinomycetota bacterium]
MPSSYEVASAGGPPPSAAHHHPAVTDFVIRPVSDAFPALGKRVKGATPPGNVPHPRDATTWQGEMFKNGELAHHRPL